MTTELEHPTYCDECGERIPAVDGGGMANRHHGTSCSLYDPTRA